MLTIAELKRLDPGGSGDRCLEAGASGDSPVGGMEYAR